MTFVQAVSELEDTPQLAPHSCPTHQPSQWAQRPGLREKLSHQAQGLSARPLVTRSREEPMLVEQTATFSGARQQELQKDISRHEYKRSQHRMLFKIKFYKCQSMRR